MRTRQAPHGFLSRRIGVLVPDALVRGMGLYHFLLPAATTGLPPHLRHASTARCQGGGAPSAGHQAVVTDEENSFHLPPTPTIILGTRITNHRYLIPTCFNATIAIYMHPTDRECGGEETPGARDLRTRSCVQTHQHPCFVGVVPLGRVLNNNNNIYNIYNDYY